MIEDIKQWLGAERCQALEIQTEGRFSSLAETVAKIARDAPTGAIMLLQACGSQPSPEDTKRYREGIAALRQDPAPRRHIRSKPTPEE